MSRMKHIFIYGIKAMADLNKQTTKIPNDKFYARFRIGGPAALATISWFCPIGTFADAFAEASLLSSLEAEYRFFGFTW